MESRSTAQATRPGSAWLLRIGFALRLLQARLRFLFLVAGLFLLVAIWPQLGNYWDRVTSWFTGRPGWSDIVSPDTEYFCPMCPGVSSGWPDKCPVCKMPLVRRKKGESGLLPEGVGARMQISPYRMQLAGIQTQPAAYLPLERRLRLLGEVQSERPGGAKRRIVASVMPMDRVLVTEGREVTIHIEGARSLSGRVLPSAPDEPAEGQVTVEFADPENIASAGLQVELEVQVPLAELEPWKSLPRHPPELSDEDSRSIFVCPDHPQFVHAKRGTCWFDENELEEHPLRSDQRLVWSCPLHAEQTAPRAGKHCQACDSLLQPNVVTYVPDGKVLAVLESAVIQRGDLQVVYVETMPGMFDGKLVTAGTPVDGYVPVRGGIEPGDRVAIRGAFLLDAETRLNPHLAAAYFGAANNLSSASSATSEERQSLEPESFEEFNLSPFDLALVKRQKVCPVTQFSLASMGGPVRVDVEGRPVYLCCEGCRGRVRGAAPEKKKTKAAHDKHPAEPAHD